jgi:hypothetical protein
MPTIDITTTLAWAHCESPRCPGTASEQVQAERVETTYLYSDNGGDLPGPERSHVSWRAASEEDIQCRHCGRPRAFTENPPPDIEPLSGYDPMFLLSPDAKPFDPTRQEEIKRETEDNRVADLEAQLAAMRAQVEELAARQTAAAEREDDSPATPRRTAGSARRSAAPPTNSEAA